MRLGFILVILTVLACSALAQGVAVERLRRMPPGQRQKLLERLPSERRERIERQLQELDRMSPKERERLQQQYESFRRLPPGKQDALRGVFRRFNALPAPRREAVQREMNELRHMRQRDRRGRLESADFKKTFSREERMIMRRLGRVLQGADSTLR